MDTVIAAAKKAVEEAAYAAAVAECEARNAAPGTAEMVMRTVLENANVLEAELIERRESGTSKKVYALYDDNARAAYAMAMKVFHDATMAAMDEAGEAFDAAYAASMKATAIDVRRPANSYQTAGGKLPAADPQVQKPPRKMGCEPQA